MFNTGISPSNLFSQYSSSFLFSPLSSLSFCHTAKSLYCIFSSGSSSPAYNFAKSLTKIPIDTPSAIAWCISTKNTCLFSPVFINSTLIGGASVKSNGFTNLSAYPLITSSSPLSSAYSILTKLSPCTLCTISSPTISIVVLSTPCLFTSSSNAFSNLSLSSSPSIRYTPVIL